MTGQVIRLYKNSTKSYKATKLTIDEEVDDVFIASIQCFENYNIQFNETPAIFYYNSSEEHSENQLNTNLGTYLG